MTQGEKAYMSTGEVIRSIGGFLAKAQIEDAASLYSRCQEDIGFQLMSRMPSDKKLRQNLVKMFFAAKDYQKAAQVCEQLDEFQKAAQLYERCDDYSLAAEMYARVEDYPKAAEMFERYGNYNQAADLYTKVKNYEKAAQNFEKAINNFLAGKYYFQIKKYQKSMELLQKVGAEDGSYLEASILIGNILAKHGYLDLAMRKYQSVVKSVPLDQNSINLYYNMGVLYAKKEIWPEAKQVFLDVLNVDFNYKDTAQKIKEIEQRMAQGSAVPEQAKSSEAAATPEMPATEAEEAEEAEEDRGSQVVSVMDGFEFMKGTPIFENLSLAELKAFYNISEIKQFKNGDILIEQGVPGKALYIIKKGTVWVQRVAGEQVTNIVELGPGVHVGEMSLIDDGPTSARVTAAKEDTETFEITRDKFDELLRSSDRTALKLYRVFVNTLSKRLRETTQELGTLKSQKS
jgi:tetratricopeptide (TPR) repeat protein